MTGVGARGAGARFQGEVRAPALAYRDVVDAFADLEHALEHHEPLAATEAAFVWWEALERLMAS